MASHSSHSDGSSDPTPIGVFWDIENCSIPRGRSASALVQRIRKRFFSGRKEVEFMCVCDTYKESRQVIEELNNAQVNIVHINATSKNAADDKLRQSLRRFAAAYKPPTCVLLLSGDVNFASDLSDIKHRYCLRVILVHPNQAHDALLACAHETVSYEDLTADLPKRPFPKSEGQTYLLVTGLPVDKSVGSLRYRLKCLSDNCGGKVISIGESTAVLAFRDSASATRAQKRMQNEDVFGSKISVQCKGNTCPPCQTRKGNMAANLGELRSAENTGSGQNPVHRSPYSCPRRGRYNHTHHSPHSSPDRLDYSPQHRGASPSDRAISPYSQMSSPHNQSNSQFHYNRTYSPHGRGQSPNSISRSTNSSSVQQNFSPCRGNGMSPQHFFNPHNQGINSELNSRGNQADSSCIKRYSSSSQDHNPNKNQITRSPSRMPSPQTRSYSPYNQRNRSFSPYSQSLSPQGQIPNPQTRSHSPRFKSTASDNRIQSPNGRDHSPLFSTRSNNRTRNSNSRGCSPQNRTYSPKFQNPNQNFSSQSPNGRGYSPQNRSQTPHSNYRTPSPRSRGSSPHNRMYSPQFRAHEHRTESPNGRGQSPQNKIFNTHHPVQSPHTRTSDDCLPAQASSNRTHSPYGQAQSPLGSPRPQVTEDHEKSNLSENSENCTSQGKSSGLPKPIKRKRKKKKKKDKSVVVQKGEEEKVTPEKMRKPRAIKAKLPSPVAVGKFAAPRYNQSPPGPKLPIYPAPTPPGSRSGQFHLYHGPPPLDTSLATRFIRELGDEHHGGWSRESSLERVAEVEGEAGEMERSPAAGEPLGGAVGDCSGVSDTDSTPKDGARYRQQQQYRNNEVVGQCEVEEAPDGWEVPGACARVRRESGDGWEARAAPGITPWRYTSPLPGMDPHLRHSPNFRRTPGASRPSSRCSSSSSTGRASPFPGLDNSASVFQPVRGGASPLLSAADLCSGSPECEVGEPVTGSVQLMVSNLDYNISAREWKKILYTEFQQQQVQVLGVQIQTQPDNTNVGFVRVSSVEDGRYAISQFHRKKIGYKRIHVSLVNSDPNSCSTNIKSEVSALLKEVTGHSLPLFKFIEMFEKRYHRNISVSELYRMKDVVEIEEQGGAGRTVSLITPIRGSPSCSNSSSIEDQTEELLESPVCRAHCEEGSEPYMEALDSASLPNVQMQLRSFAPQVHTLLQTHDGSLPLMSFPSCYTSEFGRLNVKTDAGVPLEHLITCVPGVKVDISPSGIKKIQWAENSPPAPSDLTRVCSSPSLNQQMSQFSREVVDLLKHSPQCRMAFSKFIPSYHHHFGRQCRVADYGYTKLMELFEAIPHIVQILGGGSRRLVTLSHRTQVKRFTSDMLRVLKSQASKQINVLDLPIVYNKVVGKPFSITDYGVCYIEDILSEVPESTMVVTGVGHEMVIAIPRREQTSEEMERTKQFAVEVIDLLKHSPQCRMPFNKFIPAYHHHFGKQCRVADYGFTKLIELFEAIPGVLQVLEEGDEKIVCLRESESPKVLEEEDEKILSLTAHELLKVLEEQVTSLLKSCTSHELPVPEFLTAFMRYHGHSIRLADYQVSSVMELMDKIPNIVKVEKRQGRMVITLVDHSYVQRLSRRILLLLMDVPGGSLRVSELVARYQQTFSHILDINELATDLQGFVKVTSTDPQGMVKLCPLQLFARDVRTLLLANQGKLSLQHFEAAYEQHFGVSLVPASYGYPSVVAQLQAIPHVATIRGKGYRRTVLLAHDFQGTLSEAMSRIEGATSPSLDGSDIHDGIADTPSNDSGIIEYHDEEKELHSRSPYDLLAAPVPSVVPSPDLQPVPTCCSPMDLLRFDPTPPPDVLSGLTEEEKRAQRTPLCQTPTSEMLQFAAQLLPTEVTPTASTVYYHPQNSSSMGTPYMLSGSTMFYTGQQQLYNNYMQIGGQAIDVKTLEAYPAPPHADWHALQQGAAQHLAQDTMVTPSLPCPNTTMPPPSIPPHVPYQICVQQPSPDQENTLLTHVNTPPVPSGSSLENQHSNTDQQPPKQNDRKQAAAHDGRGDGSQEDGRQGDGGHGRQESLSEGSVSPCMSPVKGTPRRSRIAARFRIPISPTADPPQ